MKKIITAIIMIVLVFLDQLFKVLSIKYLLPADSINLINGILQLNYVENTGAAFGLFKGNTLVLSVFTTAIIIFCLYYIFVKTFDKLIYNVSLVMIVSGGIGNLFDRFYRGFVVDYIEVLFIKFPVFNFADMLVTVGSFLLVIYMIYEIIAHKDSDGVKKDA